MRLVAIGMGIEHEFNLGASLAIVTLFVLSAAGTAAARVIALRTWRRALILVLSSAPLLGMGAVFAYGEINEVLERDVTLAWLVELLILSGVIVGTALLTPFAGWRAARGQVAETGSSERPRVVETAHRNFQMRRLGGPCVLPQAMPLGLPLLLAAQDAELVALGIGQHHPAGAVRVTQVVDLGGAEAEEPGELLVAGAGARGAGRSGSGSSPPCPRAPR